MLNLFKFHTNPEKLIGHDQLLNDPDLIEQMYPVTTWHMRNEPENYAVWNKFPNTAYKIALIRYQNLKDRTQTVSWDFEKMPLEDREYRDGEVAIATSPEYSTRYCLNVLHVRWPYAEPVIATSPEWALKYAEQFFYSDGWPMGEPAIASTDSTAYHYVKDVIHKRFPLGEPAMSQSDNNYIRNDFWPRYVRDYIKKK